MPPHMGNVFRHIFGLFYHCNMCFGLLCCRNCQCHTCPKWTAIHFGMLPMSRWQPDRHRSKKKKKFNMTRFFEYTVMGILVIYNVSAGCWELKRKLFGCRTVGDQGQLLFRWCLWVRGRVFHACFARFLRRRLRGPFTSQTFI